jgi:hypothetical protein
MKARKEEKGAEKEKNEEDERSRRRGKARRREGGQAHGSARGLLTHIRAFRIIA